MHAKELRESEALGSMRGPIQQGDELSWQCDELSCRREEMLVFMMNITNASFKGYVLHWNLDKQSTVAFLLDRKPE